MFEIDDQISFRLDDAGWQPGKVLDRADRVRWNGTTSSYIIESAKGRVHHNVPDTRVRSLQPLA